MHISIPCQISPKSKLIQIHVPAINMIVEAATMNAALKSLEAKLTKSLEVPLDLSLEQISEDRYLLISNYGEFLLDMVWDVSPEITTWGQQRSQRVKDAHLKSTI